MLVEEALLMTKQGIRLRLQPARQTLALKGQLPDLLAKSGGGRPPFCPLSFTTGDGALLLCTPEMEGSAR